MVARVGPQISIKGSRDGLLITFGDGPFDDLVQQLTTELKQKQGFLEGGRVTLQVGTRPLRVQQLSRIQDLFTQHRLDLWTVLAQQESTKAAARELGLATRLPGSQTDLEGKALTTVESSDALLSATDGQTTTAKKGATAPSALLLKETLRSGRSVYHEGPVIVMGDVNPGAEIIAAGDVVVWGRLRGLVHAGALGDGTAVICALDLSPTQLRIADQIAIPPDDQRRHPTPEQASIRDGQIVATPWQTKVDTGS